MSSPTNQSKQAFSEQRTRRATARARLAPYFGFGAGLIGLGIVGTFLVQSVLIKPDGPKVNVTADPPKVEKVVSGQASKISGFDKNKQPFELTARNGNQDTTNLDLVHLQILTGTFRRADGGSIGIASEVAQYDAKTKALELQGQVILQEEGRYIAHMQAASVNVDDHSLVANGCSHDWPGVPPTTGNNFHLPEVQWRAHLHTGYRGRIKLLLIRYREFQYR